MRYRIEVYWEGKWRKLFEGDYKTLIEYQQRCRVETRIVEVDKK